MAAMAVSPTTTTTAAGFGSSVRLEECPPPRSVRLGGERSQQVPVEAHVVRQDCDVEVLGRLQAVRMPVEGAGQPVQLVNIRASISTPTPLPAPAAGGPPAPPHPQRAR